MLDPPVTAASSRHQCSLSLFSHLLSFSHTEVPATLQHSSASVIERGDCLARVRRVLGRSVRMPHSMLCAVSRASACKVSGPFIVRTYVRLSAGIKRMRREKMRERTLHRVTGGLAQFLSRCWHNSFPSDTISVKGPSIKYVRLTWVAGRVL